MFRRRRRRSSVRWAGDRRGPIGSFVRLGLPALVLIGGFVYLVNRADSVKADRHETHIALPHALDG